MSTRGVDSGQHFRFDQATVAVLVSILMNVSLFNSLSSGMLALENKVGTELDIVAGKLAKLDNRLSRVEERLSIH